jgi:hypothetical protein
MRVVPCANLSNLLNNMLSNRFFQVFLGDKAVDGVDSINVLMPLLFSLYLSDIPSTLSSQFQYADDIALTYQHESFSDCRANLEVDLERLLNHSTSINGDCNQIQASTHHANRTLDIQFAAT